jgi:hypothetical protein
MWSTEWVEGILLPGESGVPPLGSHSGIRCRCGCNHRQAAKSCAMNYYLWIAGKEHGPYTIVQVREAVLEGTITAQQTARREDSNDWVPLGSIMEVPNSSAAPDLNPPISVKMNKPSVKDHLRYIRENSCYQVLRSIIEICIALVILAAAIGGLGGGALLLRDGKTEAGLIQIAAGIGILILAIGLRQSALLLIDVADSLLHEHSKGRSS